MTNVTFWVAGHPATFATRGERPWKDAIADQAPAPSLDGREVALDLSFVVMELAPRGNPRDVDNLVEPTLSALVNGLGWFGASRPNIGAWAASMVQGSEPGCRVTVLTDLSAAEDLGSPMFDGVFAGRLPKSGTDPEIPEWLAQGDTPADWTPPATAELRLGFGSRRINLGDIATGHVKSTIDCLFPLLGGAAGAPDDHIIRQLHVQKAVAGIPEDGVRIRLWALGEKSRAVGTRSGGTPTTPGTRAPKAETSAPRPAVRGNPCKPGSRKHLVCQAAIEGWSESKTRAELNRLANGAGDRLSEYVNDLRSENDIQVVVRNSRLAID